MNDSDLKQLFAEAVAHPRPDGVDLDAAIRTGRRRRRFCAAAAVASSGGVLAVVAALALTVVPGLRTDHAVPAAPTAPSELVVACSPDGIEVSSTQVTATPAGVVMRVSSTMPAGAYLGYEWSGGGGGDPLPSRSTVWTLTPPPGGLTLSCSLNGDPGPSATAAVTVIDPQGYWRPASVRDLGCASWADTLWGGRTGSGPTERDAVEGLLRQLTDGTARPPGRADGNRLRPRGDADLARDIRRAPLHHGRRHGERV